MVLKDRTLIALGGIIVLIVVAIGLYALINRPVGLTGTGLTSYSIGQILTEQQKSLILNISMNDYILNDQLVGSGLMLTGGNISEAKESYHIKNITVGEYDDADLHISGVLPMVTFIVGNESQEGPTLQAFIDPIEKRVVYIGEAWRSMNGNPNNVHMINISIADTGYSDNTNNLTDEQKTLALNIALGNASVKEYLKGQNYTLNGVGMAMYGPIQGYSVVDYVYPMVSFYIKPVTMIETYVDTNNNKVIRVDSNFVTPPMTPPMIGNNSSTGDNP